MSEMQRYLSKDNSDPENYKSLIPEVANLLNVSVSTIENYPSDIQKALCDIYVDYYRSDEITVKQALKRVVQLNSETENQIEKSNYETSQKEQESGKKLSAQSLLSREQEMQKIFMKEISKMSITGTQNMVYMKKGNNINEIYCCSLRIVSRK